MASDQPGVIAPDQFPIRHPTDTKQSLGRMVNPPRMMEMGGWDSTNKWEKMHNTSDQDSVKNDLVVQKPTNVRAAHDSSERPVKS